MTVPIRKSSWNVEWTYEDKNCCVLWSRNPFLCVYVCPAKTMTQCVYVCVCMSVCVCVGIKYVRRPGKRWKNGWYHPAFYFWGQQRSAFLFLQQTLSDVWRQKWSETFELTPHLFHLWCHRSPCWGSSPLLEGRHPWPSLKEEFKRFID